MFIDFYGEEGLNGVMQSIVYLILALLGLGFLIFIHELGHFLVARWNGIKVEIFSIGFGPVLRSWEKNGVKWQFCVLPFGGYVLFAGMDKKAGVDPYQVPDGFYGKSPIKRIQVALAGPIINIIFAFFAFTLIWMAGGQEKPFQQLTHLVGYVDSDSALKSSQIHPGDKISSINGKSYTGFPDLMTKIALSNQDSVLLGEHINYWNGEKTPFSATLPKADGPMQRMSQFGILPAQYLIFSDYTSDASPLQLSGIEEGDRIVWVDGSLIFSQMQLSSILNDPSLLLTLQRENDYYQIRVPRVKVGDLRLSHTFKHELDDWKHAASLSSKLNDLYFIPYQITSSGQIEDTLSFMDESAEEISPQDDLSEQIQSGDKIVAISGAPVNNVYEIFKALQERTALVIVQKESSSEIKGWNEADPAFESSFDIQLLSSITRTIGTPSYTPSAGDLRLLNRVHLKPLSELDLDAKTRAHMTAQYEATKKAFEKIEDPEQREMQLALLEQSQKRFMLGALLTDQTLAFNPPPTEQFFTVLESTWKTLTSLFSGSMPAKYMSGPVGIVQALQNSWSNGIKDAIYWLGFVSLNLAILNLLPIPVFDGGRVVFFLYEMITRKPIPFKTMERWMIPFLVLIVLLFIYLTYHDIARLLHRLF